MVRVTMMSETNDGSYYRELCEHLGVAVIATDLDLDIRFWNGAATRVFGAGTDRMIGISITSIIPQERREAAERMLKQSIQTGETFQFEFNHRDAQGERRELACTIAPSVSGSGERSGTSMCFRDITQRIGLQDEVFQSRKMVALGEMAGAIAHHFNNILGGVVTSIDFASASGDEAIRNRVLAQIGSALQRATTLVKGLAAFAEGDRRADDLCDLTELIHDLADDIEQSVAKRNIDFKLVLHELPVIPVARVQVMTILRNITQNAIEAMPQGGSLWIDVSVDTDSVIILVGDTGCGLDEHDKSRVFEPFWSTKGGLSTERGGAIGLGLAIAHGLIQMMGGTILVTSEVGAGSCFRVTLPKNGS